MEGVLDGSIGGAASLLRDWASYAPLVNAVLLVLVLGGLVALNARMRK